LNGIGNVTRYNNSVPNQLKIPQPYTINFDPPMKGQPKRYLLRLINTAFDATFVFSIDNHKLQIVSSDFVPIHEYTNTSVLVGIGQRYNVIVTADQPNRDENFWIRTWKANCFQFNQDKASAGYETTGILRYGDSQALPKSQAWDPVSKACSDETYTSLKPILPWSVSRTPANVISHMVGEEFTVQLRQGHPETIFPLAAFSMGGDDFNPLHIDYENPTFLHLNNTGKWNPAWVVIPENFTSKDWVSLDLVGQYSEKTATALELASFRFSIVTGAYSL
jgi:Multicopper oxidase